MPTTPFVPSIPRCLWGLLAVMPAVGAPLPTDPPPLTPQEIQVRWAPPAAELYAGQTFELTLEVTTGGSEEESGLLQLFPQTLDLPVQIEAFGGLERLTLAPPTAGRGPTAVVDGSMIAGTGPYVDPADPARQLYRLTRRLRAVRAGRIELPAPIARYATATEFREDFVRGRIPVDRIERSARGEALVLEILPLPESDRPFSFDGAIGGYALEQAVDPNAVRVGESMVLHVLVRGATPFDDVPAPRVESMDGLDVLGVKRASVEDGTSFTFELVARSMDATLTPQVTFTSFDPLAASPAYVTLSPGRLPVSIRPAAPGEEEAQAPPLVGAQGAQQTPDERTGEGTTERPRLVWTPLVLGSILAIAFASVVRRRRARGATTP